MMKAVIFDIVDKKKDQLEMEMKLNHKDGLLLCLSLMELSLAVSKSKRLQQNADDLPWIELKLKNPRPSSTAELSKVSDLRDYKKLEERLPIV